MQDTSDVTQPPPLSKLMILSYLILSFLGYVPEGDRKHHMMHSINCDRLRMERGTAIQTSGAWSWQALLSSSWPPRQRRLSESADVKSFYVMQKVLTVVTVVTFWVEIISELGIDPQKWNGCLKKNLFMVGKEDQRLGDIYPFNYHVRGITDTSRVWVWIFLTFPIVHSLFICAITCQTTLRDLQEERFPPVAWVLGNISRARKNFDVKSRMTTHEERITMTCFRNV